MKKSLGIALGVVLVAGFSGFALADDMSAMSAANTAGGPGMTMPGMPGMKMNATPVDVAPTGPNEVNINNFSFNPATLTVAAGTKVTWTNRDDDAHTIVNAGSPPLFKSAPLDTDDTFSFTFDKPGTYKYICSIHPFMSGTIIVQ
jgi:plastocyanin